MRKESEYFGESQPWTATLERTEYCRHLVGFDRFLSSFVGRPSGYRDEEWALVERTWRDWLYSLSHYAASTQIFQQNVMMNTSFKLVMALSCLCSQSTNPPECCSWHVQEGCKTSCLWRYELYTPQQKQELKWGWQGRGGSQMLYQSWTLL